MITSILFLSWFLFLRSLSYLSVPVTKIVSPPLKTGLMARRMETYGILPADSWKPIYNLKYVEVEYFAAVMQIGSPKPQRQSVIIDTGRRFTYITCSGCLESKCYDHEDPMFIPSRSKTFLWDDCSTCPHGIDYFCLTNTECSFDDEDFKHPGSSGRVFTDVVDFGWGPMKLQMGCSMFQEGGAVYGHADGILGLGIDANASAVFQFGEQLHTLQLAHCFKNSGEGTLIFGEWPKPKEMAQVPLLIGSNQYYRVRVLSIWVGQTIVISSTMDNRLENNSFNGTVWDTGSPHMWMPTWLFKLVQHAFSETLKSFVRVNSDSYEICFNVERSLALRDFPLFRFELSNNVWLDLTPMQYLISATNKEQLNLQCLDLVDAGNNEEGIAFGLTNMLDMLISYDYSSRRFGFMKHDCDCFLLPGAHCVDGSKTKGGLFTPPLSTKLPAWISTRSKFHPVLKPSKFFLMFLFGMAVAAVVTLMIRTCVRKKYNDPLRTAASPEITRLL